MAEPPDHEVVTMPLAAWQVLREAAIVRAFDADRPDGFWRWQPTTNRNQPPDQQHPEGNTDP